MIIDYKMKLELGKQIKEIQMDWYGKRGISLHGCYMIANKQRELEEQWSLWLVVRRHQTGKDAFFTQLETTFLSFAVYLISGMNVFFLCINMFLSLLMQAPVHKNDTF